MVLISHWTSVVDVVSMLSTVCGGICNYLTSNIFISLFKQGKNGSLRPILTIESKYGKVR